MSLSCHYIFSQPLLALRALYFPAYEDLLRHLLVVLFPENIIFEELKSKLQKIRKF